MALRVDVKVKDRRYSSEATGAAHTSRGKRAIRGVLGCSTSISSVSGPDQRGLWSGYVRGPSSVETVVEDDGIDDKIGGEEGLSGREKERDREKRGEKIFILKFSSFQNPNIYSVIFRKVISF